MTTQRSNKPSQIVGLTTVRDEEDIVFEALAHVAPLVDCVLIVDCGSVDRSIAEIQRAVALYPNLIYLGAIGPHHARQVRRHVWKHCVPLFDSNTWWMIADADEFVEPDVRNKVEQAGAEHADHIFSIHANFYYTDREYDDWKLGKEGPLQQGDSIGNRRRYHRMNVSQIRFFRHLPWLRWNEDNSFPRRLARSATTRVLFRHYQYRNPTQIEQRIAIRRQYSSDRVLMADNPHWLKHHAIDDCISKAEELQYWDGVLPLVPTADTPDRPQQPFVKSLAKYGAAIMEWTFSRESQPVFFNDFDFRGAITHAMQSKTR